MTGCPSPTSAGATERWALALVAVGTHPGFRQFGRKQSELLGQCGLGFARQGAAHRLDLGLEGVGLLRRFDHQPRAMDPPPSVQDPDRLSRDPEQGRYQLIGPALLEPRYRCLALGGERAVRSHRVAPWSMELVFPAQLPGSSSGSGPYRVGQCATPTTWWRLFSQSSMSMRARARSARLIVTPPSTLDPMDLR